MAISKKPLLAFFFFTTILLMLLNCCKVNAADSLSFTFGNFTQGQQDLIFQGDAHVTSTNVLRLTRTNSAGVPQPQSVGRVLYSAPLRLWQRNPNRLLSFQTTINFVLTSPSSLPSDGFAFFIAPPSTTIPSGSSGGLLGLFSPNSKLNTSANHVVAVEFDTFFTGTNTWDPPYTHIGIDVNSIRSSTTVKWDRREGAIGTATINYNSVSKVLSVDSFYPGSIVYRVSYVVDLGTVLPEWVRVGFTAATGDYVQVHDIRFWTFSSTLQNIKDNNTEDDDIANNMEDDDIASNKKGDDIASNKKDDDIYIASVV